MQKVCITLVAFLCLALTTAAQSQEIPAQASFRFSEQLSNGPAGTCGCFALEGAAGDLYFNLRRFAGGRGTGLGLAADIGVERTGNVSGAGYGLVLSTFTAGPRFVFPPFHRAHPFAQTLFGFAHGSGSQFPQGNVLESSANSFALNLGAGADYPLNKRLSIRILQLDYLRTSLPNGTTDWQNNLRIGAGITLRFPHR